MKISKKEDESPTVKTPSHLKGLSAKKEHGQKIFPFFLGTGEYAFEARHAPEFIPAVPVTRVPSAPAFIKGIIPFKGEIIAVIDLKNRLGIKEAAKDSADGNQIMLIAGANEQITAFLVDGAANVCDAGADVLPAHAENEIFVTGTIKPQGRAVRLLSLEKLLNISISVPAEK